MFSQVGSVWAVGAQMSGEINALPCWTGRREAEFKEGHFKHFI